ncbi:immune inhibitor A domain-containing protein, partial [candidate division KSB1 bacterium]
MINKVLIILCFLLFLFSSTYYSENKYYIALNKGINSVGNAQILGDSIRNINIIAIRVEFQEDSIETAHGSGLFNLSQDTSLYIDPPPHNRLYFEDHLEALKRYYDKVSRGKVNITYRIFPEGLDESYKLLKEMKYYSPNTTKEELNKRLSELFRDSFLEADNDPAIDFSDYNSFMVFHAGVGSDFSVNPYFDPYPNDIPSVFLNFNDFLLNLGESDPFYKGIPVNEGQFFIKEGIILPETENRVDEDVEIGMNGITAHQFGHQLGLPSLFNTETGRAGIGQWSLMDMGFGNYSGLIPCEPCAWSKVFLGWEEPIEIESGEDLEVHASISDDARRIYKITITSEEYYLIENRRADYYGDGVSIIRSPRGVLIEADEYDADIPGTGLFIWHIDERIIKENFNSNRINADKDRKGIYLEEADGSQDIGELFEWILPGFPTPSNGILFDAFFRGNNDSFTPFTNPPSSSNCGANSHIYIHSISDTGNVMTFSLEKKHFYKGTPAFAVGKFYGLSPYSAEIDGDDKTEIIAVTKNGDVLAWNGEDFSNVIA